MFPFETHEKVTQTDRQTPTADAIEIVITIKLNISFYFPLLSLQSLFSLCSKLQSTGELLYVISQTCVTELHIFYNEKKKKKKNLSLKRKRKRK